MISKGIDLSIRFCSKATDHDIFHKATKLRYSQFKERLRWQVKTCLDVEQDRYDDLDPDLVAVLDRDRNLIGCVRLLPTTGPHMLPDVFPELLDGRAAERGADIWESSRFVVDTAVSPRLSCGLARATVMLFAGMLEWGLGRGVSRIVTVTDVRLERIMRRVGWSLRRYGPPKPVGTTMAVAGEIDVSADMLVRVRALALLPVDALQASSIDPTPTAV